jgi:hypothetical protein
MSQTYCQIWKPRKAQILCHRHTARYGHHIMPSLCKDRQKVGTSFRLHEAVHSCAGYVFTIVWANSVEKPWLFHIRSMCSLRHPECNAHVPYCHLWPARIYNTFPHYLTNGTIFEKKKMLLNMICVLIFCTTFVRNVSYSKKDWTIYDKKMYIDLRVKYPLFLLYFNKTWIFSVNFRKKSTQV